MGQWMKSQSEQRQNPVGLFAALIFFFFPLDLLFSAGEEGSDRILSFSLSLFLFFFFFSRRVSLSLSVFSLLLSLPSLSVSLPCFFFVLILLFFPCLPLSLLFPSGLCCFFCFCTRVFNITTTATTTATLLLLLPYYLLFLLLLLLFLLLHSLYTSYNMSYNTRRKSLSLPSLGIHLPSSSRRSPSISKSHDDQPSKKVKRSHDSLSISPEPQLAPQHHLHHQQHHRPSARRAAWEHTPPPSPLHGHGGSDGDNSSLSPVPPKIDTEGINDDIVVAVIRQLEATHNRPHLVKELAAVLVSLNDTVAKYVLSFTLPLLFSIIILTVIMS